METNQTKTTTTTTTKPKTKNKKQPRPRPLPPDVTSRNLAIEKRRRKDMNRIFSDLASCVPPPASSKRFSKRLIVIESLQQLRRQRDMCIAAGRELRQLLPAHNDLIAEVNALRSRLGIPVRNAPRPPSTAFLSLMDVENQTYGESPDGVASPNSTKNYEPQPSARQGVVHTSLPGRPLSQDLVSPGQTSDQDRLLNCLDGTRDVFPPENWQRQLSEHLFSSSNVQDALAPDMDWWELNVSGTNSESPWKDSPAHILPWEEACNDVLRGHPEGAFVPFPRPFM